MLLIGDVHQKNIQYEKIIDNCCGKSVVLGDFGFDTEHKWLLKYKDTERHKGLFGNHDYYPLVNEKHSLGHFGMYEGMFFVRGAETPWFDRGRRMMGVDLFENEQLTYAELTKAFELYVQEKPEIVISHDCPSFLRYAEFDIRNTTTTSETLDAMFDAHKPKYWFFGHFHKPIQVNYSGCQFRCLGELESVEI